MLIAFEPHGIFNQILHTNITLSRYAKWLLGFAKTFLRQSQVTVLHICVSIMLKCIRTHFRTEPISEKLC